MNTTTNTQAADDNIIEGAITEVAERKTDPALAVLNPVQYATELFKPFEDQLATLRRAAGRAKYDITTREGMDKAKELRSGFIKVRTTAEKAKTEAKRPIDQSGKLIIEHYNKVAEAAKIEEGKHDAAIKAQEAAIEAEKQRKLNEERERVEALQRKVEAIHLIPGMLAGKTSAEIEQKLTGALAFRITSADYQDYVEQAQIALDETIDELRRMLDAELKREADERQRKAEQEELGRLRAEQAERDRAAAEAAERQRQADFEQQERMRQMQAEQEKNQRIMQELQRIQQIGMREGDARALLDNLEFARAIEIDLDWFGLMGDMAMMAKKMAVDSLTSKYNAALALELPIAHGEALAEDAERSKPIMPTVVFYGQPDEIGETAFVAGFEKAGGAKAVPEPEPMAPNDDEIIDVLAAHFHETRAMIATWLLDLSQEGLHNIIVESLK